MKRLLILLSVLAFGFQTGYSEIPGTKLKVGLKLERLQSIESPTVGPGTGDKAFKPKAWLLLEGRVSIQAAPKPPTGYLDKVSVFFYVAAKNPEGKNSILMKKEVKYVNVPVDQEFYVCAFMSPSSIKRLTGGETIGAGTFTLYGISVVYNDKVVAAESNKKKPGWWDIPSPSLVPTDSFPLLNKNETPFAMFWYDRYPEIAPVKENDSSSSSSPRVPASVTPAPAPETPVAQ